MPFDRFIGKLAFHNYASIHNALYRQHSNAQHRTSAGHRAHDNRPQLKDKVLRGVWIRFKALEYAKMLYGAEAQSINMKWSPETLCHFVSQG